MILSRNEILKEIRKGNLTIEPFSRELVGPCSVDFCIGNEFKTIRNRKKIHVKDNLSYPDDFHKKIKITKDGFLSLKPRELVLGVTKERFTLGKKLCGWIQGRSKLARLGLLVHVSSSFIQPGSDNKQVLEIVNMSPQIICLHPGAVVGQVVFQQVKGNADYKGRFKFQTKP